MHDCGQERLAAGGCCARDLVLRQVPAASRRQRWRRTLLGNSIINFNEIWQNGKIYCFGGIIKALKEFSLENFYLSNK
jgi:hypothetical protein